MKIVYVVKDYTNSGGMERVLLCKSNYLVSLGFEVFIISNYTESKSFFYCDPRVQIRHIRAGADKKDRVKYLEELSDCLSSIKPDISISTGLDNTRYLFEVKDGSKKILENHFPKYNRKYWLVDLDKYAIGRFISDWYSSEKSRTAKQYDKFVILTEEDRASWRGLDNIEVIPSFLFSTPDRYSENDSKSVVVVGRFTYQKGYEYLIKVWKIVIRKHPDWKLVVYGNGRKKNYIEKLIRKNELRSQIELKEPVKDIFGELTKHSIYLMTSRYEGHPLSLLEAMACGLPPVAFACKCGPRDTIADTEDGFLVDFGNIKECAQKINLLIEDEKLRKQIAKAARDNVLRYTADKVLPRWVKLFENLTK